MVAFGTKKKDAAVSSGNGIWLRNFQRGETTVRFIDEPEDWIVFKEHYNSDKHWFPCSSEVTCPGCSSDDEQQRRKSTKYATNLYLVKSGEVRPFKIPISLANALERRAERNGGTICNRDYAILKSGSGLETSYDVDQEAKYDLDAKPLRAQAHNIEDILQERWKEVVGEDDAAEVVEEKIPFKETTDDAPTVVEFNEGVIRKMSIIELSQLATDAQVDLGEADTKEDMADKLITALG